MSLLSTVADSLAQALRRDAVPDRDPAAVDRIRREMLTLLPPEGLCCEADRVRRRVAVATDAKGLWFLRTHLHQHLSRACGERLAMQKVHALWPHFEHTLSPSLLGRRPAGLPARSV
jgi:hypothetical protein